VGARARTRVVHDLEFLEPAQHVEVPLAALDYQEIAALQRLVRWRHDVQLAGAKKPEQPEIERIGEAAPRKRCPLELRLPGHAHDEDALVQTINLAQLALVRLVLSEVERTLEACEGFGFRL